jgi:hypothetical protein
MYIFRQYDADKRLDRAWYSSSNIVYSECDDNLNALKTLRVTFKNGATYEYKDVDVNDYLMFMNGGLDGSNGKALNKFIKPKYEFEKLENLNVEELMKECEKLREKSDKKHEESE